MHVLEYRIGREWWKKNPDKFAKMFLCLLEMIFDLFGKSVNVHSGRQKRREERLWHSEHWTLSSLQCLLCPHFIPTMLWYVAYTGKLRTKHSLFAAATWWERTKFTFLFCVFIAIFPKIHAQINCCLWQHFVFLPCLWFSPGLFGFKSHWKHCTISQCTSCSRGKISISVL